MCPARKGGGQGTRVIPLAQRNFNKLAIMRRGEEGGRREARIASPVFCAFADNDAGIVSLDAVACPSSPDARRMQGAVSSQTAGLSGS